MKQHLKVAIPMSLQFSVIAVGLLIIQSVCNSFGASTIAAFTSALRIEQLATQPMVALGLALATYSAQISEQEESDAYAEAFWAAL